MTAKKLKTVKCLSKILFNIDIMDVYLLPYSCIPFKRQLESATKALMSEAVQENFKISEPADV